MSNSVSRAEAVSKLETRGIMRNSNKFDRELVKFQVDWWPKNVSRNEFPIRGDSESDICQPFVSNMLKLFVKGVADIEKLEVTQS